MYESLHLVSHFAVLTDNLCVFTSWRKAGKKPTAKPSQERCRNHVDDFEGTDRRASSRDTKKVRRTSVKRLFCLGSDVLDTAETQQNGSKPRSAGRLEGTRGIRLDRSGFLYAFDGDTSQWKMRHFMLADTQLVYTQVFEQCSALQKCWIFVRFSL